MGLSRLQRWGLLVLGAWAAVLAAGFVLRWGWAIQLWPWPDGRLSYIFVGSIFAAVAAAAVWLAVDGDRGMLAPAAANVSVMLGGISGYLFLTHARVGGSRLLNSAVASGVAAAVSAGVWWWAHGSEPRDPRRAPAPLRWSFAVFVGALVVAGAALVTRAERVFPWPLHPDTSVMFGWIFLGDACFFLYAVLRPLWAWAPAQLAAFLAYDLVLIPPLVAHLDAVPKGHGLSLVVYLATLCFSAAVAVYYLFVSPVTRVPLVRARVSQSAGGEG